MFPGQPNDGGWHWPSPVVDEDPEHAISCVISIDLNHGVWASTVLAQTTAKEYRMKEEARRSHEEGRRKKEQEGETS